MSTDKIRSKLRTQNHDLSWQLQQMRQQCPPLRVRTSNDSEDTQALDLHTGTYMYMIMYISYMYLYIATILFQIDLLN